ncbi:MAG: hypothetical protein NXI13_14540 [Proteobacteria bacterium]|nr:hypothetical protein [Pseudomonadota bacterium]
MQKLVLTMLAFTMIAGTAAAENVAKVTIGKNTSDVKATSPVATNTRNSVAINTNVAGSISNKNNGFYALNTSNIAPIVSRLNFENVALAVPTIRTRSGDISISYAESLAVGANVAVDNSTFRNIKDPAAPIEEIAN